jgi:hypothetical protein
MSDTLMEFLGPDIISLMLKHPDEGFVQENSEEQQTVGDQKIISMRLYPWNPRKQVFSQWVLKKVVDHHRTTTLYIYAYRVINRWT